MHKPFNNIWKPTSEQIIQTITRMAWFIFILGMLDIFLTEPTERKASTAWTLIQPAIAVIWFIWTGEKILFGKNGAIRRILKDLRCFHKKVKNGKNN